MGNIRESFLQQNSGRRSFFSEMISFPSKSVAREDVPLRVRMFTLQMCAKTRIEIASQVIPRAQQPRN